MSPRAIIREALRALFRNKLRSSLTVLGITIGIGAVICVVAIGQAGSAQVQEQLNNLGDNYIWIEAGSRAPNGIRTGSHGTKSLMQSDVEAILKQVPLIKLASANVDSRIQIIYGNKNWSTGYRGVAPEWFQIKRWQLTQGAPFTQADVDHASNVCVIGETVRQQLFESEVPIGKIIRIKDLPCQVMGVLVPRGQTGFGLDQDDTILNAVHHRAEEDQGQQLARRHRLLGGVAGGHQSRHPADYRPCCASATMSVPGRWTTSTCAVPTSSSIPSSKPAAPSPCSSSRLPPSPCWWEASAS